MEAAPEAWRSAQHTYEFANYTIQLNPEDYGMPMPTNTGENPTDLDELVLLKNKSHHTSIREYYLALPYSMYHDDGIQNSRNDPGFIPGRPGEFAEWGLRSQNLHGAP